MGLQIKKIRNKDRKGIVMNTFIDNGDLKRCEQEKDLRKKGRKEQLKELQNYFLNNFSVSF